MEAEGWTLLDDVHSAVYAGDAQRVDELLRSSASEALATASTVDGPLLHLAAKGGCADVVAVLLAHGLDAARTDAAGCSAATVAAACGHAALAASLEHAALSRRGRKAVRSSRSRGECSRRCWLWFWMAFSSEGGALVAPYIWVGNALFVASVYLRMAPWSGRALAHQPHTHAALLFFYALSWALWLSSWRARPPSQPSAAARDAYSAAVAAIASGRAAPGLEAWLSHAHRAVLRPRERVDRVTGRLTERFDHFCPFIANGVGLHNQNAFAGYCASLTVACALYTMLVRREWAAGRLPDAWLEAAQLDCGIGTFAVGQLALWQLRLALRNLTAAEMRAAALPRWDPGLYYMKRATGGFVNPFDEGMLANWRSFWRCRAPPVLVACEASRGAGDAGDGGVMTAASLHASLAAALGEKEARRE